MPELALQSTIGPGMAIENAVVLVTGAAGGIGSALVTALLEAGADEVIAAGRDVASTSPRVTALKLDITDAGAVAAAASRFASRVDILINNAGVNGNRRVLS